MKINKPGDNILDKESLRRELMAFIDPPASQDEPPCPNCISYVVSECAPSCSRAPKALSADPENHPLEPKVVPISFEMASSGVFQTCWSCEGHIDQAGKLWKFPQVSFYVGAPVYAQILLRYINSLANEGKLSYAWHVLVSDYGPLNGVTYTLQPNLQLQAEVHLGKLQQDLLTVSQNMVANLKAIAKELLSQL